MPMAVTEVLVFRPCVGFRRVIRRLSPGDSLDDGTMFEKEADVAPEVDGT